MGMGRAVAHRRRRRRGRRARRRSSTNTRNTAPDRPAGGGRGGVRRTGAGAAAGAAPGELERGQRHGRRQENWSGGSGTGGARRTGAGAATTTLAVTRFPGHSQGIEHCATLHGSRYCAAFCNSASDTSRLPRVLRRVTLPPGASLCDRLPLSAPSGQPDQPGLSDRPAATTRATSDPAKPPRPRTRPASQLSG